MRFSNFKIEFQLLKLCFLLLPYLESVLCTCKGTPTSERKLYGFDYKKISPMSFSKCTEECGLRANCLSINHSREKMTCEINSAQKGGGNNLVVVSDYVYCEKQAGLVTSGDCKDVVCASNHKCITFRKVEAKCIRTACDAPPTIENAKISSDSNRLVGTTVIYECNPGYALMQDPSFNLDSTCMASGDWSPAFFMCITCPEPSPIANANIPAGSKLIGATRTYACDTGYTPIGTPTIQCQTTATWTSTNLYCQLGCGEPDTPANAQLHAGSHTFGSTRNYGCVAGHTIIGNVQRTCNTNGQWTAVEFTCEPDCPMNNYPAVSNADKIIPSGFEFGNILSYSCQGGYAITGGNTVSCLSGGVWGTPTFTCDDINECQSNPCQNGGYCVNNVNSYSCNCQNGYAGTNCQTDINECQSNPCQNGGSCVNNVNSYSCNCQNGYTGTNCQTVSCPVGFIHNQANNLCFIINTTAATWNDALTTCNSSGAKLVQIYSQHEFNIYVSGTTEKTWIGATDAEIEGVYKWADDTPVAFLNWASNQGDNTNQDCICILSDGMYDQDCTDSKPFICHVPLY